MMHENLDRWASMRFKIGVLVYQRWVALQILYFDRLPHEGIQTGSDVSTVHSLKIHKTKYHTSCFRISAIFLVSRQIFHV